MLIFAKECLQKTDAASGDQRVGRGGRQHKRDTNPVQI